MRHVAQRPSGEAFENWSQKAREASLALVRSWEIAHESAESGERTPDWAPSIDERLYKELRQIFLFDAFHKKCAYCEANASANYAVQVEHYRPKAAVTQGRKSTAHPGYFWLAYEWWNLLLSCAYCNTDHTDPIREKSHPGKKNEFPVRRERVQAPTGDPDQWLGSLNEEEALLLNPYFDHPEQHIDFQPETGMAVSLDERGRATIEICDLNRPSLCERRLELRSESLPVMILKLMNHPRDLVIQPDMEFTMWRGRLLQSKTRELNEKAGAPG
jgi:hypothetical protein